MKRVKEVYPESHENDWAKGCAKCRYGVVSAPELTGAAALYLERIVQAIDGDVTFCDCRAGKAYRAALFNRYEALKDAAKRDKRMQDAAQRKTHPDIEATRRAMQDGYGRMANLPTIRYVGPEPEAVTEPAL